MKSSDVILNRLKAEHKRIVAKRVKLEVKPAKKVNDQASWQAWQDELNILVGKQIGFQQAIKIVEDYVDA